jgi:hypothetical protein
MWRDEQTNKKLNKQTNKNSMFRNNRISVLGWVLVFLLQHQILVLVFKQKLCCSCASWFGSVCCFFFSCLSEVAAWSTPSSVGFGSLHLYVVLMFRNQLCSPPAILPWSWVFTVLDYWGLVSLPHPLSLGQVNALSAVPLLSAHCDCWLVIFQFCIVVWLWMLLTGSWDELCGLLAGPLQAVAYHQPAVGPSAFPAFVN